MGKPFHAVGAWGRWVLTSALGAGVAEVVINRRQRHYLEQVGHHHAVDAPRDAVWPHRERGATS
jgi:hypothetical protein